MGAELDSHPFDLGSTAADHRPDDVIGVGNPERTVQHAQLRELIRGLILDGGGDAHPDVLREQPRDRLDHLCKVPGTAIGGDYCQPAGRGTV